MLNIIDLEKSFEWKVNLLVYGCSIKPGTFFSKNTALKKIHLYSHSDEKPDIEIPDDLLLPHGTIVRLRYRSTSPFRLELVEGSYIVRNTTNDDFITVQLLARPTFSDMEVDGVPISSICSYLGSDLVGITPSNYCFYFQTKKQCQFCEILPTFKSEVDYSKSFKSLNVIEQSILKALKNDPHIKHVAITTGNIQSYDASVDYFVQIGQRLQKDNAFCKAEQVLATLMPPEDFSKISLLKESGFTKVYFALEVFAPDHFKTVCPGKADYGYDRLLKALEEAVKIFGKGNVYTNFVYGIQSLNSKLEGSSYCPDKENELSLEAVNAMLAMQVIPAFTLYHFGGYNSLGNISLSPQATKSFFYDWGDLVYKSGILPQDQEAVLFSTQSLSNTLFNDSYRLAYHKEKCIWK